MLQKLLNISVNSLKRRSLPVMLGKVAVRVQEFPHKRRQQEAQQWCLAQATRYEAFAQEFDAALWAETKEVCERIAQAGAAKLRGLEIDLGGGGNYPLLYFLTRYLKAKTVVETGVAAGWSSQAILTALKKNGGGRLYSSDFPYFRCSAPEKLVGYIVDEGLKGNWSLHIDGDQHNLPEIAASIEGIDLFHYDSDKSYKGRARALDILAPRLTANSVVVFDDIQDNFHFRDFTLKEGALESGRGFKVFEFEGKYMGIVAPFLPSKKG